MILPDHIIRDRVQSGDLEIEPYDEENQQPSSYDLTLSSTFKRFTDGNVIDPRIDNIDSMMEEFEVDDMSGYTLDPLEYVLATTEERVYVPRDLVGQLKGRSSWGRVAVVPHTQAGYIDAGYNGKITLEIMNFHTDNEVVLPIGTRICQIIFQQMLAPCEESYGDKGGKYQEQDDVQHTKISEDYDK